MKGELSPSKLSSILFKLKLKPVDILRSKESKEEGIDKFDGEELIKAMCQCPKVIQRPIIISDSGAIIGRPPERVKELLLLT